MITQKENAGTLDTVEKRATLRHAAGARTRIKKWNSFVLGAALGPVKARNTYISSVANISKYSKPKSCEVKSSMRKNSNQ